MKSSTVSKVPPVCKSVEELVRRCCAAAVVLLFPESSMLTFVMEEGVQVEYLAVGEVDLLAMFAKSLERRY